MLWRGRNALTFGRGTTCSLAIILPCGDKRGIDQLESYDFGAERKRLKSPDLVSDKQTAQWAFAASSPR